MTFAKRQLPSLFLLLGGALLLLTGLRMGSAGVGAYQAEAFMADWGRRADEPAIAAWRVAEAAAGHAVALYPVPNGDYLDRLGRVHAWRHFRQPIGQPAAAASRRQALAHYREAATARPTWPDTQARLAHAKLLLGEPDAEFESALTAADRLGRYRWQVNEEVARISLASWWWLDEAQRQRGERHAVRLLAYGRRGEKRLVALGAAHGLPVAVCVAATGKPLFRAICP